MLITVNFEEIRGKTKFTLAGMPINPTKEEKEKL